MEEAERALAEAIEGVGERLLLVVTGAGVSRASGIATFRGSDPGAVWKSDDIELATFACFQRDPVAQWSWYLRRFEAVAGAAPNPAHQALAGLERQRAERGGGFLLVTQNIDTLHEQAGSRRLIKVHGSSDRVRCSRFGCPNAAPQGSLPVPRAELERFRQRPHRERLPACPRCGALLRTHVLFFDEAYQDHRDYRFEEVLAATEQAALTLFVGTSFSVGITDIAVRAAARQPYPAYSIDPSAPPAPAPWVEVLPYPAEELLPKVLGRLDAARQVER